jgi:hypothetical protein
MPAFLKEISARAQSEYILLKIERAKVLRRREFNNRHCTEFRIALKALSPIVGDFSRKTPLFLFFHGIK